MTAQPFDAFAVGAALRTRLGPAPSWAIVLGSGVGVLTEHLADARSWAYAELDLPQTGVSGHDGRLHLGRLGGVSTALLSFPRYSETLFGAAIGQFLNPQPRRFGCSRRRSSSKLLRATGVNCNRR